eukprot:763087-Hanusia_phi.AAC.3
MMFRHALLVALALLWPAASELAHVLTHAPRANGSSSRSWSEDGDPSRASSEPSRASESSSQPLAKLGEVAPAGEMEATTLTIRWLLLPLAWLKS